MCEGLIKNNNNKNTGGGNYSEEKVGKACCEILEFLGEQTVLIN